ncbi:hypothetical protein JW899_04995 [Candidatus Uhrbacteria bacterium]|nr:hypothetical protein [Candidatus Uhrbacteria bacterium]
MITEIQNLSLKMDGLIEVLTPPNIFSDLSFWSTVVLVITLIVLIWYTIETHRIASQTKESNLRPVVLRSGFIENWEKLTFKFENGNLEGIPLKFAILKNIATSINGYIIKNGYKFKLLFGNAISKVDENKLSFIPKWGWMKPDGIVYAFFEESGKVESQKPNQIVVNYQDIEGNKYFTVEDDSFDQKTFRGKR